jgi:hypothetical protein
MRTASLSGKDDANRPRAPRCSHSAQPAAAAGDDRICQCDGPRQGVGRHEQARRDDAVQRRQGLRRALRREHAAIEKQRVLVGMAGGQRESRARPVLQR